MSKKIKVRKWELVYALFLWFLVGLWIGYLIGGSSSWIAKSEWRESIKVNAPVCIGMFVLFSLVIERVAYYYKTRRFKKLRN